MQFYKIVPYKLRRALSMAAIAGAPLLPVSCCKIQQDPIPPQQPTHDAEIEFRPENIAKALDKTVLQSLADDETVRYIYLTPAEHCWGGWTKGNITDLRTKGLQICTDISPKIRGRGDFNFKLGEASKVPEDSLWFVKNGWTINKQHQK